MVSWMPCAAVWWLLVCLIGFRVGEALHPGPGRCTFDQSDDDMGWCSSDGEVLPTIVDGLADEPWPGDADGGGRDPAYPASSGLPCVSVGEDFWCEVEENFRLGKPGGHCAPNAKVTIVAPSISSCSTFHKARTFAGHVPGFVFTTRGAETGYYRDHTTSSHQATCRHPISLEACLPVRLCDGSEATEVEMPRHKSARRALGVDKRRKRSKRRLPAGDGACVPTVIATHIDENSGQCNLEDSWWKDLGLWAVDVANVNSWGSAEANCLPNSSADVLIMQETKLLGPQGVDKAKKRGKHFGWNCIPSEAWRTAADRASGGCAVACKKSCGIVGHEHIEAAYRHRLHLTWVGGVLRGGLHCGAIWLKDCEGLSSSNMAILDHAAAALGKLRGPWVLGGDWNLTPDISRASGWLDVVKGVIVATQYPTCHGKVYDFFVVAEGLAPSVAGVMRIDNAELNPHSPSRLLLRGDARRRMVRQLVRDTRVPGTLPEGPAPLSSPGPARGDMQTEEQVAQATIQWYAAARGEVASLLLQPSKNRQAHFKWSSAPGPLANSVCDATAASVQWRLAAKRLQESVTVLLRGHSLGIVKRHAAALARLASHCTHIGSSLTSLKMWVASAMAELGSMATIACDFGRGGDYGLGPRHVVVAMRLAKVAMSQACQCEGRAQSAKGALWKVWLNGGISPGNLSGERGQSDFGMAPTPNAFRFAKGQSGWMESPVGKESLNDEVPEDYHGEHVDTVAGGQDSGKRVWSPQSADIEAPLCDQADVELEANSWAKIWSEGAEYENCFDPSGSDLPEELSVQHLRTASLSFPSNTGLGVDNFAPRALARLSDGVLLWLCTILMACERLGSWTKAVHLVLTVLLPKADGGRRPIGLFPTVIRVWMRARTIVACEWERVNDRPAIYGGSGKGAQRAAWQSAFTAEAAHLTGLKYAQVLLDLVKAFEMIPHHHIWAAAIKHNFNLWVLRLSLAAYRLARAVGINGMYSRCIVAARGIAAGSGFATTELRILLLDVVDSTYVLWRAIRLTLYVDDITLECEGSTVEFVVGMVKGATDHVVNMLQDDLDLEVSTKKSVALASLPSMAKSISRDCTTKAVKPVRSAKMLGVPSGGGARRVIKGSKARTRAFRLRIARIHSMRKAGVRTAQLVRTAGTPMVTYGVEILGMSDSHLEESRRAIARAASAEGGGKSYEMVLYALDGNAGTMDPAFDAHVLPIHAWAMAWWESWRRPHVLNSLVAKAVLKLATAAVSAWALVVGPVTALVASAIRIGWTFLDAHLLKDDVGAVWDLTLDPPIVVADAVKLSVRRWRLQRVFGVLPQSMPIAPDIVAPDRPQDEYARGWSSEGADAIVIDFADIIAKLLKPRSSGTKLFENWAPCYKPALLSAISGGQWSQARLAATRKWTTEVQCQLCHGSVGTLEHRHMCPSTTPIGGWQAADAAANSFMDTLGRDRLRVLVTRGVGVISVVVPPAVGHDTFTWLVQPPEDVDHSEWTWFIDGSLMDEARVFARRAGFGIVVVDADGKLVGLGRGRPPKWLTTAAGAEAWAFWTVVRLTPFLPRVITDCLEVLQTLQGGRGKALAGNRRLARVWQLIFGVLENADGDTVSRVCWMPAHKSKGAIGNVVKSDGSTVTFIEWRANRLVDVLAKSAAAFDRVSPAVLKQVKDAGMAVEHSLAKLGAITHACNHHKVAVLRPDGSQGWRILRDSAPGKRAARRPRPRPQVAQAPLETAAPALAAPEGDVAASRPETLWHAGKASRAAAETRKRRREEADCVTRLVSQRVLLPPSGDIAAIRMAKIAERVRLRAT